jgi:hypothetical protein
MAEGKFRVDEKPIAVALAPYFLPFFWAFVRTADPEHGVCATGCGSTLLTIDCRLQLNV